MASDPKRLSEVFQHIQRIKSDDYLVRVGDQTSDRFVECLWHDLPERSKLALLLDVVDWTGISNRDQAAIVFLEIYPGKITDAQRSLLIETAVQTSYEEMLEEASARGGTQREKDIGIER